MALFVHDQSTGGMAEQDEKKDDDRAFVTVDHGFDEPEPEAIAVMSSSVKPGRILSEVLKGMSTIVVPKRR